MSRRADGNGGPFRDASSGGGIRARTARVLERTTRFDLRLPYIILLLVHPPDLDLSLPFWPVSAVQLHEAAGFRERLLSRRDVEDREAADHFLRLGERAIGRDELSLRDAHARARRGGK